MKPLAAALLLALLIVTPVLAHSGTLAGTSACDGWSATVTLNHNTTPDRLVTVTTDLPGASGLSGHFDTSYGLIWSATGPALTAPGHVTLTIGNEFSKSLTLEVPSGCPSPTPSSTPTTAPSSTPIGSPSTSPAPSASATATAPPSATPSASTEPTPSDAPSATPTGSEPLTNPPHVTPPPTSTVPPTPADGNAGLLVALALSGLAGGLLTFRRLRGAR